MMGSGVRNLSCGTNDLAGFLTSSPTVLGAPWVHALLAERKFSRAISQRHASCRSCRATRKVGVICRRRGRAALSARAGQRRAGSAHGGGPPDLPLPGLSSSLRRGRRRLHQIRRSPTRRTDCDDLDTGRHRSCGEPAPRGLMRAHLGHRGIAVPDLEEAIRALRLNRRKNLQDDVDFRKLRSSLRCQADEARSNKETRRCA